jgi:hypothetical protein
MTDNGALFDIHRIASRAVLQKTPVSRSSQVAKVVTDVAVGVIRGALGDTLGVGTIGKVVANFRAGKDL